MPLQFASIRNIFRENIEVKKFTFTIEGNPPKGFVTGAALRKLERFKGKVDAIAVTDCALSKLSMNSIVYCYQIQERLGISCISHFTCRDKNSLAIQSDLLGAYSLGIENFIAMRGDSLTIGNEKKAKGVFHYDSPGLLRLMSSLNHGKTESGLSIKTPPDMFFGAVANPSLPNQRREAERVGSKIKAGAKFIVTQPVFDHRLMRSFIMYLAENSSFGKVPIIMGVMPIKSLEQAQFLNQNVPGLFVPAETLVKFKRKNEPETGISICHKTISDLRNLIQGIHIFSRGNHETIEKFYDFRD
ncbi:methylenetetrahydrofolate reductase [Candidatus Riflebacteria bacterium]